MDEAWIDSQLAIEELLRKRDEYTGTLRKIAESLEIELMLIKRKHELRDMAG